DRDLAVALGLVHAHLRLAQMEMLRRITYGRLAETLGPVAVPFDHALRLLDPARAVPAIEAALPESTREWVEGFVAGINHYVANAPESPFEFRLLGVAPEPWTVAEVLGIARLAAADINWLLWMRLLRMPRGPDWPDLWARLIEDGAAPVPSLGSGRHFSDEAFTRVVLGLGRAGSNAVAVSGARSVTGQPWLAGDPHLSLSLPSVWLQAAYRSPSYNVAGLMIPGIPVMAIGRNPRIAWGGTNLHALSSELFDVSDLPASAISERRVRINVRWSPPREVILRDTAYGPIISDAPMFGTGDGRRLALRWVGHRPSDEMSALLAINRARDWTEFRAAADGFAVPGQNLVYADRDGHIGKLRAAWLPRRPAQPPADIVSPLASATHWSDIVRSAELPAEIDPPSGFIPSANDRPPPSDIPLGWFFSPSDRAERLAALLGQGEKLGLDALAASQRDVAMPFALALRDRICAAVPDADPVVQALAAWNGRYDGKSTGALAFELVLTHLLAAIVPPDHRSLFGAVWHGRRLLAREIDALPAERLRQSVQQAVIAARSAFGRFRQWGEAHRLRLAHPLGAIPGLGRRYRFIDWPWPGSSDTVFKAAHGPVIGRHAVAYGSNARYVFDLSDPDGNYLVLLGGQDGHPGSLPFLDQAELFRRGEYVKVPLDPATARLEFRHVTVVEPTRR
ncbi:MAG: penicillin acylase family protein, partial [Alphaproteobacteria bacterium]|nr:penicillin acylase family protein [Alphaproteobacteria bacterium]